MKIQFLAALLLGTTSAASFPAKENLRKLNSNVTEANTEALRRVWVRYQDGQHDACLRSIQNQSMELHYNFHNLSSMVVTATDAEIEVLRATPEVLSIDEDPKRYLMRLSEPRDRTRNLQGQFVSYGIELVQANLARDAGLTGAGVTVCVMDSGFDWTHEDFNSASFTGDSLVAGENWFDDSNGHGTHVTGIIAAANNDFGVVGVAPEATIHMVDVLDASGSAYSSFLVNAAYKCSDAGAKIISMSLGGGSFVQQEQDAFTELYTQNGILSIAAAGNNGDNSYSYPASYENVLSVGAIDSFKNVASFSQFNDKVDLVAPGVGIWSTLPMNFDCTICVEYASSSYVALDGTSQAAPHVAGVAALLWSYNTAADVNDIYNALIASAQDLGDAGRDDIYGNGLVLAMDAFAVLTSGTQQPGTQQPTCVQASLTVKTDQFPLDTHVLVQDLLNNAVLANEDLLVADYEYVFTGCLDPNGCYSVEILDDYGDGLCCDYGAGFFDLQYDGVSVFSGDAFGSSAYHLLGSGC